MSNRFRILLALVWCGCMALDYLSGTAAALHSGSWSSTSARQGLWHKGGMILVVAAAAIADGVLGPLASELPQLAVVLPGTGWPGLILPLVLAWYSITELGSVLENAMVLGAPVPSWLSRLLKVGLDTVDYLGSEAADQAETAAAASATARNEGEFDLGGWPELYTLFKPAEAAADADNHEVTPAEEAIDTNTPKSTVCPTGDGTQQNNQEE